MGVEKVLGLDYFKEKRKKNRKKSENSMQLYKGIAGCWDSRQNAGLLGRYVNLRCLTSTILALLYELKYLLKFYVYEGARMAGRTTLVGVGWASNCKWRCLSVPAVRGKNTGAFQLCCAAAAQRLGVFTETEDRETREIVAGFSLRLAASAPARLRHGRPPARLAVIQIW